MKKYILLLAMLLLTLTLNAKTKNPKRYIQGNELFLYPHGIYLAYPGKLYRITALYKSPIRGYFTYKSKMKRIPLEFVQHGDWNTWKKIQE